MGIIKSSSIQKIIFLSLGVICLFPFISPPIALVIGLASAQFIEHPYQRFNHKAISILLQISVVGLGFGMNITSALKAGKEGILFTIIVIISVLVVGFLMGKLLKVEKKHHFLYRWLLLYAGVVQLQQFHL